MVDQQRTFRNFGAVFLLLSGLLLVSLGCTAVEEADNEGIDSETLALQDILPEGLEYPKWQTVPTGEYTTYNQRTSLLQRGLLVYDKYCAGCHGDYGDGQGPAAIRLLTKPRDFTSGIYKFRSTDSGSLPLEADLARTITRGLSRVSMPSFPLLPERDKLAVIEYIKAFYPRWDEEKDRRRLVPVPKAPDDLASSDRVLRGRVVYLEMQCSKCHGVNGRGKGATQTEYTDAWGYPQKAFDFTRGALKGGNGPEDIYRTFHTGLRSIMPAFEGDTLAAVTIEGFDGVREELGAGESEALQGILDQFPADGTAVFSDMGESERLELAQRNSWDLVAYILSLRNRTTTAAAVLGSGE
jgi:cytochrome c oxidase cbb3-type subunit 2